MGWSWKVREGVREGSRGFSSPLELTVEGERESGRVRVGVQERLSERETRTDDERREPARDI